MTDSISWLDGESLYGLAARLARFEGHTSAIAALGYAFSSESSSASERCVPDPFGLGIRVLRSDFQQNIGRFCAETQGRWGSPGEIIRSRTIIPSFLHVCDAHSARKVLHSVLTTDARLPGALTSSRAALPLRHCARCADIDFQTHGFAYWRIEQQYPGALICLKHRCWLIARRLDQRMLRRLVLPIASPQRLESAVLEESDFATCLTVVAIGMATLPLNFRFDHSMLRDMYRFSAAQRFGGSITREHDLDLLVQALAAKLAATIQRAASPHLTRVLGTPSELAHRSALLAFHSSARLNPICHLVMIAALFDSWRDFIERYYDRAGRQASLFD